MYQAKRVSFSSELLLLPEECVHVFFSYCLFPSSVNEVVCHGIPDSRKLQDGDIVNLDVTVYYKGYHGDLNETFFVGKVSDESVRLVQCAYESLRNAISKRMC